MHLNQSGIEDFRYTTITIYVFLYVTFKIDVELIFEYLSHNKLSNCKLVEHLSFLNYHMKRTIFANVVGPILHALFLELKKK